MEHWNVELELIGEKGFDVDLNDVRIQFAEGGPTAAYTVNGRIAVDAEYWSGLGTSDQVELLAHELAHTVQQDQLGGGALGLTRFLARYLTEIGRPDNYTIPSGFEEPALYALDPLSRSFTYDQTAERFRNVYVGRYAH